MAGEGGLELAAARLREAADPGLSVERKAEQVVGPEAKAGRAPLAEGALPVGPGLPVPGGVDREGRDDDAREFGVVGQDGRPGEVMTARYCGRTRDWIAGLAAANARRSPS